MGTQEHPVPRQYRVRKNSFDVSAVARHSYARCVTSPGLSPRSGSPCRRVEACCSRSLPSATSCAYSFVRIVAFAHLTVCSGWYCDYRGLGGDAMVLVQPATVDRWHRDGLHRCWRRRSRRPGRPRIDSECRALIQRLARENRLWGAPRIHGELLKLGIVVSERTGSRYLRGRAGDRHRPGGHSS